MKKYIALITLVIFNINFAYAEVKIGFVEVQKILKNVGPPPLL